MGLVLDASVVIAAEREKRPVSELLASLEAEHAATEFLLSSITVMELEQWLAPGELARSRRKAPQISRRGADHHPGRAIHA